MLNVCCFHDDIFVLVYCKSPIWKEARKSQQKKIMMNLSHSYCARCSLQFDKKSIFDMHLSIVHKERVDIKEELSSFENEPNLGIEMVLLRCEPCDSSFETKTILDQHNSSYHEENRPLKCDICNYIFSKRSSLKLCCKNMYTFFQI